MSHEKWLGNWEGRVQFQFSCTVDMKEDMSSCIAVCESRVRTASVAPRGTAEGPCVRREYLAGQHRGVGWVGALCASPPGRSGQAWLGVLAFLQDLRQFVNLLGQFLGLQEMISQLWRHRECGIAGVAQVDV